METKKHSLAFFIGADTTRGISLENIFVLLVRRRDIWKGLGTTLEKQKNNFVFSRKKYISNLEKLMKISGFGFLKRIKILLRELIISRTSHERTLVVGWLKKMRIYPSSFKLVHDEHEPTQEDRPSMHRNVFRVHEIILPNGSRKYSPLSLTKQELIAYDDPNLTGVDVVSINRAYKFLYQQKKPKAVPFVGFDLSVQGYIKDCFEKEDANHLLLEIRVLKRKLKIGK